MSSSLLEWSKDRRVIVLPFLTPSVPSAAPAVPVLLSSSGAAEDDRCPPLPLAMSEGEAAEAEVAEEAEEEEAVREMEPQNEEIARQRRNVPMRSSCFVVAYFSSGVSDASRGGGCCSSVIVTLFLLVFVGGGAKSFTFKHHDAISSCTSTTISTCSTSLPSTSFSWINSGTANSMVTREGMYSCTAWNRPRITTSSPK